MTQAGRFEDLVSELEQTAGRLRAGDLAPDDAAKLVERCAEMAGEVATELERMGRDVASGGASDGQERLL